MVKRNWRRWIVRSCEENRGICRYVRRDGVDDSEVSFFETIPKSYRGPIEGKQAIFSLEEFR